MSDDQAEVWPQGEECSCTNLREIISTRVGRLARIYLSIEERHRIIADNELRRAIPCAHDFPRSFHPHRVIGLEHFAHDHENAVLILHPRLFPEPIQTARRSQSLCRNESQKAAVSRIQPGSID